MGSSGADLCSTAPFLPSHCPADAFVCLRPVPISAAVTCAEAAPESDNVATQYGPLAQLVARLVRIEEVRSSNLLGSTSTAKTPRDTASSPMFAGSLFVNGPDE